MSGYQTQENSILPKTTTMQRKQRSICAERGRQLVQANSIQLTPSDLKTTQQPIVLTVDAQKTSVMIPYFRTVKIAMSSGNPKTTIHHKIL